VMDGAGEGGEGDGGVGEARTFRHGRVPRKK
jgi:hypothetical protein